MAPTALDEDAFLLDDPLVGALNVAAAKARAVQPPGDGRGEDEIVLAADTLVVVDEQILGKPADADAARQMLRALRGRPHAVLTGVTLRARDGRAWGGVVSTLVFMRAYDEAEVEAYIRRGEPYDKAGGYAVQDTRFTPVERLEGCYLNVVGLPLCAVSAGLTSLGVAVVAAADLRPPCDLCHAGAAVVAIAPPGQPRPGAH